jgi:hypothetical protein
MLGNKIFPPKVESRKFREDSALGITRKILQEFQAGEGKYPGKLQARNRYISRLQRSW